MNFPLKKSFSIKACHWVTFEIILIEFWFKWPKIFLKYLEKHPYYYHAWWNAFKSTGDIIQMRRKEVACLEAQKATRYIPIILAFYWACKLCKMQTYFRINGRLFLVSKCHVCTSSFMWCQYLFLNKKKVIEKLLFFLYIIQ